MVRDRAFIILIRLGDVGMNIGVKVIVYIAVRRGGRREVVGCVRNMWRIVIISYWIKWVGSHSL